MCEIIYIIRNPEYPEILKIGRTKNLEKRIKALSSHAGVPIKFELVYACTVKNAKQIEKIIHTIIGDNRKNLKREFFKIDPERVIPLLEYLKIKRVYLKNIDYNKNITYTIKQNRRPNFNFSKVGIKKGKKIKFVYDQKIVATVVNDRKINYKGEIVTLSQATKMILEQKYNKKKIAVRGPDYWVYLRETLTNRRMRMESE